MSKRPEYGTGMHQWEEIDMNTHRLKVPGGWIYRYDGYGEVQTPVSMVFVAAPVVHTGSSNPHPWDEEGE